MPSRIAGQEVYCPKMKSRVGKVQRGIRRAFIVSDGEPLLTASDLALVLSTSRRVGIRRRVRSLSRAAPRFAMRVGRLEHGRGRPNLWAPNAELMMPSRANEAYANTRSGTRAVQIAQSRCVARTCMASCVHETIRGSTRELEASQKPPTAVTSVRASVAVSAVG